MKNWSRTLSPWPFGVPSSSNHDDVVVATADTFIFFPTIFLSFYYILHTVFGTLESLVNKTKIIYLHGAYIYLHFSN